MGRVTEPRDISALTENQKKILDMVSRQFMTQKQISIVLKVKKQYVSKVINQLRSRGYLSLNNQSVDSGGVTRQPLAGKFKRVHAVRLYADIVWKDGRYSDRLKGGKPLLLVMGDNHKVICHGDSIEIIAQDGFSFRGETVTAAMRKFCEYWHRFLVMLENDLKVILVKPRSQNLHFQVEVADEQGGLSKVAEGEGERIKIYSDDTGRLWFLCDKSHHNEDEAVDPTRSIVDMEEVISPIYNDWRRHHGKMLLPSEMQELVGRIAEAQRFEAEKAAHYAKNFESHVDAIKQMSEAASVLRDEVKSLKNTISSLKKPIYRRPRGSRKKPDYVG